MNTLWGQVQGSFEALSRVAASTSGEGSAEGLDFNYITPTLMALGKVSERRIPELLRALQDNQALVWNLSDKNMAPGVRSQWDKQVLEAPWTTPAQFSQVPSLECMLSNCYAIKSWLDLRDKNVAVVHCTDGKRRTGILVACYLKYIGAFEHTAHAFDFFCNSRASASARRIDSVSLAPSYRILFENMDRVVDNGCFLTRTPLHLRYFQ